MKKWYFVQVVFLLALSGVLRSSGLPDGGRAPAVPLAGNYTVGATGCDYPTITAAVNDLNASGVSASVTFYLEDATYSTSETFPITINQVAGVSAANTVTIKTGTGVTTAITGSAYSGAVIKILGNYIILDGSNASAGTSRDLTITNGNANSSATVLIGSTGTTPVTNVTIKNCILISGINTGGGVVISDAANPSSAGYFNNVYIQNNDIRRAYVGVFAIASVEMLNGSGLIISGNLMNSTGEDALKIIGVYVEGVDGASVYDNTIGNMESAISENDAGIWFALGTINSYASNNIISNLAYTGIQGFAPVGIYVANETPGGTIFLFNNTISGIFTSATGTASGICVSGESSGISIYNNMISNIKNTNTGVYGYGANGIWLGSTSESASISVYNNVIFDVAGQGNAGGSEEDNGYGIIVTSGAGYGIYFNSVNMNTNQANAGGLPAAFNVTSGVTVAGAIDLRDNIFANTMTSGSYLYAIYCGASSSVFGNIDYNDYVFPAGNYLGYLGSDISTLSAWQTATGKDVNSVSTDPKFTAPDNLQPIAGGYLVGTAISGITTDINGNPRSAVPDLGAYEGSETNWTGAFSTDWSYFLNWDRYAVPLSTETVIVPYPTSHQLHVTASPGTPAVCSNLVISNNATVTIDAGKALTVTNVITNQSGTTGLVIESDGTNGTGSLIETSGAPATVQRYIANDLTWHFLSSPVTGQAICNGQFAPTPVNNSFGTGSWNWDFYYFNPNAPATGSRLYWVNLRNDDGTYNGNTVDAPGNDAGFGTYPPSFTDGRGYLAAYAGAWSGTTHTFAGSLHAGIISKSLAYNAEGWTMNLVGNPYPSSIDWKDGVWGTGREALARSGNGYDYWIWNDDPQVGTYGVSNSADTWGTNGTSQYIAPGQAFFVKAGSSGSLVMNDSVRVHSSQTWLKEAGTETHALRLKVTTDANTYSDEMIVEFNPEFSGDGSDKMWSFYPEAPEICAMKDGNYYSIDRYGSITAELAVALYIKTGTDATYTILAGNVNDFALSEKVYLDDLKTGGSQELKENPAYSFAAKPGDDGTRFRLRFSGPYGIGNPGDRPEFTVYAVGNTVFIKNLTGEVVNGTMYVCDMLGRNIARQQIAGKNSKITLTAPAGVYLVNLITDHKTYTRKIFIH